jgi:hypothetical protein
MMKRSVGVPGLVAALIVAGCGEAEQPGPTPTPRATGAPFRYHGQVLRFPPGTADTLVPEGVAMGPWARLVPDAKPADAARYVIDLGRRYTGQDGPDGFGLGATFYPADAVRTELGDGYRLYCNPPERREPAFNCAALLRTVPFAAIQFREEPAPAAARAMVREAEAYLGKAKAG